MKKTDEYLRDLENLKDFFGFDLSKCEQGSDEWHHAKLGVISGSNVYKIMKRGKGGKGYSKERDTYMKELVGQIATRQAKEIKAAALEWGKANEVKARTTYEMLNDVVIEEIPFIYKELPLSIPLANMRCGVSLDGRIRGRSEVIEIKSPFSPVVYLDFVLDEKIKQEYVWQMLFQCWVADADWASFVNHHPLFAKKTFHGVRVPRDNDAIDLMEMEIIKFIREMDEMLAKLNIKFGDQWR